MNWVIIWLCGAEPRRPIKDKKVKRRMKDKSMFPTRSYILILTLKRGDEAKVVLWNFSLDDIQTSTIDEAVQSTPPFASSVYIPVLSRSVTDPAAFRSIPCFVSERASHYCG